MPSSYSYNKHFHPFLKKEICERDEKIPLFLAGQKKTRKDVLKLITHMKFISNIREIEMSIGLFFQWIILSHAEATLLDLNRKLKMLLAYTELQCTLDHLVFLKTLRTTGLAVRNTPLTNIPKGFSSEITLEVA